MDGKARSQKAALERLKKAQISVDDLWERILQRDKVALGRAISLIESEANHDIEIADELIQRATLHSSQKNILKIGVTGVPGVGKSTFINAYTQLLVNQGLSVAVLAIDPSSQQSKGSILGDKTRMKDIFAHPNVLIRPSPSGKQLGGVAHKTQEVILLCEAAGYDRILVETVGVGQSEIAVYDVTDLFLLLMLPGAGDELQGIKRGIMELADILIVHKADGENETKASVAAIDYKRALKMFPTSKSSWKPVVLRASSEPITGHEEVHQQIEAYFEHVLNNGYLFEKRKKQWRKWFDACMENEFMRFIHTNSKINNLYESSLQKVVNYELSPQKAARKIVENFHLNEQG